MESFFQLIELFGRPLVYIVIGFGVIVCALKPLFHLLANASAPAKKPDRVPPVAANIPSAADTMVDTGVHGEAASPASPMEDQEALNGMARTDLDKAEGLVKRWTHEE